MIGNIDEFSLVFRLLILWSFCTKFTIHGKKCNTLLTSEYILTIMIKEYDVRVGRDSCRTVEKEGRCMHEFDDAVLECFLENQLQLFPERVAENPEAAESFLEECMAVVVDSVDEVVEFFEEEGLDIEDPDEILDAAEVFDVGDGRYLIVEG